MALEPLNMKPREAIIHLFECWDVPLILTDEEDGAMHDVTHAAPANAGGICWPDKSVIWSKYQLQRHHDLCGLIHELAHVLIDVLPTHADEVDSPMLALEETHRYLANISRKGSDSWMQNFQTGSGYWPYTTWVERQTIMTGSFLVAQSKKLLDATGAPTFQRYKRRG